ncbi:MAG TPA: hypothetical protein VGO11_14635, partial [Chthoniobacteraceae bacterium]|nr:hypothetical protein [Chthoniobacteraceae bacterium]
PFARAVLITVAALALYVLSVGPVGRATYYGFRAPIWLRTAYHPLWWTAKHCEPVRGALYWYLNLWFPPLKAPNA